MATMADRFLREVKRMHQLRQDINEMTPEEADELVRGLGDDAADCRRLTCHGAGCFSAAAAPANRTQCRRRCIPRCALGYRAFTSSPQPRPTFTTSTSKANPASSPLAAVIHGRVGCRRGGG